MDTISVTITFEQTTVDFKGKPEVVLCSINDFLLCLGVSLVCQLGDIFISYLKRKAKVKDTGRILPGHGGILDRMDGIIFAIPFAYIYHIGLTEYFEIWIEIISNAFKNL